MHLPSLLAEATELLPGVIALRRDLHSHPEVGNYLPETRAIVEAAISDLPLDVHRHETTSGIVAVLNGESSGPGIVLRGDMDALQMPEDTGLEFASRNEGTMHACGHDLHTAMLVGAAQLLSEHCAELPGPVVFMFQPGEEGHHGARFMLEEGLLSVTAREPAHAFALHVSTAYPAGTVHLRPGPQMASADEVTIRITGSGGHASAPYRAIDPVPVAAEIVLATEVAVTRELNVFDPGVVTFGRLTAGTAHNVIPASAELLGTIRAFSSTTRETIHAMLHRVAANVAAAHRASATVSIDPGYPVTANDPGVTRLAMDVADRLLGPEAVSELTHPIMGAEDWSYVLDRVPGVMAFLGACPPDLDPTTAPANHSNLVVFDEDAMAAGVAMHAAMAVTHASID